MNVELRHLRYFVAVAEELHFGRAAIRLSIAQPTLSQQIRRLEREIGADLFNRGTRRVELSPAGIALLPGAKRTLDDSRKTIEQARAAGAGITGHLNIGFIEIAAIKLVPEAVRRFRAERPAIGLTLLELGVEQQIQGLVSGRLDIGFVRKQPDTPGLVTETVLEERLVVVVPAGHALAGREELEIGGLAKEPLIAVERSVLPELYDDTVELLRERGAGGDFSQRAGSVLAVMGLVAAGLGLAILPASVRDLKLPGAVAVPLADSPRAAILALRKEGSASLQLGHFLDAVRGGPRENFGGDA